MVSVAKNYIKDEIHHISSQHFNDINLYVSDSKFAMLFQAKT